MSINKNFVKQLTRANKFAMIDSILYVHDLWCLAKENRESGENPGRTHHCNGFVFAHATGNGKAQKQINQSQETCHKLTSMKRR